MTEITAFYFLTSKFTQMLITVVEKLNTSKIKYSIYFAKGTHLPRTQRPIKSE